MDNNIFRLDGKVALVTGASYGIGMAAKALANAGATIVYNDRDPDRITEDLAENRRCWIDARAYLFDVTDEKAVRENIMKIISGAGVIDMRVNNAGIFKLIPALEIDTDEFREGIDIDLTGNFIVSKAVAPVMIKKRRRKDLKQLCYDE